MTASRNLPIPFKNGDEEDALTSAKRFFKWASGVRKRIKSAYWKRVRQHNRTDRHLNTEEA